MAEQRVTINMSLKGTSKYLGRFWSGAEAAYGVIIAMTFTSTLRGLSDVTRQEIYTTVVLTALFCCIAWGIADGFFYGWEYNFNAQRRERITRSAKQGQGQKDISIALLHEELDDSIIGSFDETVREKVYESIVEYLSRPQVKEKRAPSLKIFFPIILSTFLLSAGAGVIVLIPFTVFRDVKYAIAISNVLGVVVLFLVGFLRQYERGFSRRIVSGSLAAFLGAVIAFITVILGG